VHYLGSINGYDFSTYLNDLVLTFIRNNKEVKRPMADIEVMGDPKFKQFIQSRRYRERSIKIHHNSLKFYTKFLGKTPTEIIDEAIKEEEDGIRMSSRKIKEYLINFVEYLTELGNAPQTIKNKINSVKTFYHEYDILTPRIRMPKTAENPVLAKIPGKEHIIQALKHTSIRNRAMVLLMSSSGMGSGEIRSLTYNHFIQAINDVLSDLTEEEKLDIFKVQSRVKGKDIIGVWDVIRYKTKTPYITFSTPESIHALVEYLIDNQRNNNPIKSKDDYLFAVNGKPMEENTLHQIFKSINDKCGFGKQGYQRFFRSHAMRKFMGTSLFGAGMDRAKVKMLLGHTEDETNEAYFKFSVKDLKNLYFKYMDAVTIQETKTKTIKSEEYQYLTAKLLEKDETLAKVEQRLEQIEANKKEKRRSIDELFSNPEFLADFQAMAKTLV
jgi:site-specific recombinase XerD